MVGKKAKEEEYEEIESGNEQLYGNNEEVFLDVGFLQEDQDPFDAKDYLAVENSEEEGDMQDSQALIIEVETIY